MADSTVTTTSKALLLSVVFPRVHHVYIASSSNADATPSTRKEEDEEDNDKTNAADTGNNNGNNKDNNDDDENDKIVGYVEGDEEEGEEVIEHLITAEEMATMKKIDTTTTTTTAGEEVAQGEDNNNNNNNNTARDKIAAFFGIINGNNNAVTNIHLTQQAAVEALKNEKSVRSLNTDDDDDQEDNALVPNTEINVEALVRITFKDILLEGHLFNSPNFTDIQPISLLSNNNTHRNKEANDIINHESWCEMSVMIKSQSVGIVLERLERIGVGSSIGTISLFKTELCRTASNNANIHQQEQKDKIKSERAAAATTSTTAKNGETIEECSTTDDELEESSTAAKNKASIEAAKAEWKNAASRLRIEQVKEQIYEQAALSFDFLSLLIIASILAGIGLITNSTVVIVASMLVSPIMGPVMGMTFGSRILDWKLAQSSAINEIIALSVCILIGLIIGFAASFSELAMETWPTNEMSGRGDTIGLITGIAIAIPSGMGVALSILGNNTASLVGVAISASLLPPAVNAGICWAHALLMKTHAIESDNPNTTAEALVRMGGISFALTVVNIVCIWFAGIFMFSIKEVAPTKTKSAFWSRDIKIAREEQKSTRNVNGNTNDAAAAADGKPKSHKMDIEKIRIGIQKALEEEQKQKRKQKGNDCEQAEEEVDEDMIRNKLIREMSGGTRPAVTFNLDANPVPIIGGPENNFSRVANLLGLNDDMIVDSKKNSSSDDGGWLQGWLNKK